ncbi:hypothetical protein KBY97_10900 [Synechococcus sp. ATX 2A4]|uniref:hypothetical protein n=1 Tax=Synechococcus sp. ATX 2A4 TaxID=2823727 RepID=UPI0020CFD939|nr:hypothetical protein [Synechococcus sp. ATX 2A4]MCP9885627.1 hypothetical protein [Synechococcus sp. ATX 2A4]
MAGRDVPFLPPTRRQSVRRPSVHLLEAGIALPIAIFAIFAISLGVASTITIATNSRLGSTRLNDSRDAREAAEAGMAIVISELNKRQNRKLLVADVPLNGWSTSSFKLRNPCAPDTAPTTAAVGFSNNTVQTITGSGGNRQFVLKTLALKNFDRSARFTSSADAAGPGGISGTRNGSFNDGMVNLTRAPGTDPNSRNVGYIEVTVEGRAIRGGNQVSTARITREFQVVPKCCNLSFGAPGSTHGNDNRFCSESFPRILLGLNGGGFNAPGNAHQIRVQNPDGSTSANRPDNLLCFTTNRAYCGPNLLPRSIDGVPIQPIEISLPSLPQYPLDPMPTTGITIISNSAANSSTATNAKDYLRVNAAGQVELCNVQDNNPLTSAQGAMGEPNLPAGFVASSCSSAINSFCTATDAGTPQAAYHCRIRKLELSDDTVNDGEPNRKQNNSFFIDTSRGPIYLYFNAAWNPASPVAWSNSRTDAQNRRSTNIGVVLVDNWDDGQIQHLHCASPSDTTPCNRKALPDQSSRAGFFSDQNIVVAIGDDGFMRDVFTYLPYGELNLRPDPDSTNNAFGLPNFRGSAWLDRLTMGSSARPSNSTQFAVPPPSLSFFGAGNSLEAPFGPLVFEWVARSVTSNCLF